MPDTLSNRAFQIGKVVSRVVQGNGTEQPQHYPGEPDHGERLLTVQLAGLDAEEAQQRAHHQRDAYRVEVPVGRVPFLEGQRGDERHHHQQRREQHQHSKVMADDPNVV